MNNETVIRAYKAGFTSCDIKWIEEHGKLSPDDFFATACDAIEKGDSNLKQIKIESDIPLVYDETADGKLIRGYEGTATEEPAL